MDDRIVQEKVLQMFKHSELKEPFYQSKVNNL